MNSSPKMPGSIWALGFVSLLMDTSSEMVHGVLPVFLVSALGASYTTVGFLEGISEATTLILKVFAGPLSDWLGRRKPLVVLGYGMGALSKIGFALAQTVGLVFAARVFDRMGKGIRGAPRDALVADLAPAEIRGKAFGLRQSLDTVGAFLGPVIAIALMHFTQSNYRAVFWFALLPGTLCVLTLIFAVHEPETRGTSVASKTLRFSDMRAFPPAFWWVVAFGAVFQLARFSEAFLILRAQNVGLGLALAPLVLIVMNVVYSLSAYPLGHLSDRIGRKWLLAGGFVCLMLADLCLGLGASLPYILLGIVLWGLHMGMTQGTLAAMVADTCNGERRGTAYGIFNLASAIALLVASPLAGLLWDKVGPGATFLVGAALTLLSLLTLSAYSLRITVPR